MSGLRRRWIVGGLRGAPQTVSRVARWSKREDRRGHVEGEGGEIGRRKSKEVVTLNEKDSEKWAGDVRNGEAVVKQLGDKE